MNKVPQCSQLAAWSLEPCLTVQRSQAACCFCSIRKRDPSTSLQVEVVAENTSVLKTQGGIMKHLVISILNFSSGCFACKQLTQQGKEG